MLLGGISRNQFFSIALISSFAYYIFPGYLFSMLSSISWVCWIFPCSVTAQQIGSGLYGMGVGAFALDWSAVASYLGSPLASSWFATANVAAGYAIIMYILVPAAYWLNVYKAKTFPFSPPTSLIPQAKSTRHRLLQTPTSSWMLMLMKRKAPSTLAPSLP